MVFKKLKLLKPVKKFKRSESAFPERPKELWAKGRLLQSLQENVQKIGLPNSSNLYYVRWLKKESMLYKADKLASQFSGSGLMWRNPYARPRPRSAIRRASVWYTAYPASMITKNKQSIISALGDDQLWQVFQDIGIKAIHTGPMKKAGGLDGWQYTSTVDGHFDRISTDIDPIFGDEDEFSLMCQTAKKHGGIIIDDIVPGHTGKGSDFRLAEMKYKDYPGIYHMIEILEEDWHLLPEVPKGKDSINISPETEATLKKAGYIIGKLPRVIFYEPGIKETNWSVTKKVKGTDGVKRRWVYLHYFKDGQPSLNWLDPSFAGMKLVIGDALHSLDELGSSGLRLDANGFLGIERSDDVNAPAWSEGHPFAQTSNQVISSMVRKLGGFTFQELNLTFEDIKQMGASGADLSYDFINRPAYQHALITGNAEFLRLTLRSSLELGIDTATLIHGMQNHDELTFELVHFLSTHKDDLYEYRGQTIKGSQLRDQIRKEAFAKITGKNAPYNLPSYGSDGISCTTVSLIAAVLNLKDIYNLSAAEIEKIKRLHLLLAAFNAMQPGVFALSGWDLTGSLTLKRDEIRDLIKDGDTRWINRGSYDLLGVNKNVKFSSAGMPKAFSLYGSLPEQLSDPTSFASQLKTMLYLREKYQITTARQIDIPATDNPAILTMVHKLNDNTLQVTVLNFSDKTIKTALKSDYFKPGSSVTELSSQINLGQVGQENSFDLEIHPYDSRYILLNL